MPLMDVISEIVVAHERWEMQMGGPKHEDEYSPILWTDSLSWRVAALIRVRKNGKLHPDVYRKILLQIAVIAVTALDAHDRTYA